MKNKILSFLMILTLFLLVGCRMPVDYETVDKNLVLDIEMIGNDKQFYKEPEEVTFKTILEGTYHLNYTIEWYVNDERLLKGGKEANEFKFTPPQGKDVTPNKYTVYAQIIMVVEEKQIQKKSREVFFTTVALLGEVEIQPKDGPLAPGEKLVADILYEKNKTFEFTSTFDITQGKITDEKYAWVLEKYEGSEVVEEKVLGTDDELSLSLSEEGDYRLYLKFGKFQSNRIDIQIIYGEINISQEIAEQKTTVSLDYASQVESQIDKIEWFYIAKEDFGNEDAETKLEDTTSEIVFTAEDDVDGLIYSKVTFKNGFTTTTDKTVVATNFTTVTNEEELFEAVKTEDKILITNDITIETDQTLTIKKPLTIVGLIKDDKRPNVKSELGIDVIISVSHTNNVWFKDLIISDSARYNILYRHSEKGLIENIKFDSCGKGGKPQDPGSGLYIDEGEVHVLSAEVTNTNIAGIRVEGSDNMAGTLTIERAKYIHDKTVWAPIASVRSKHQNLVVDLPGYIVTNAPLGKNIIRVWTGEGETFSWEIIPPSKIEYWEGGILDMNDIQLTAYMGGEDITVGMEAVYMLMDKLTAKGLLKIIKVDDEGKELEVVIDAIIEGYEDGISNDKLIYTYEDLNGEMRENQPIHIVGFDPGTYQVHIIIGGGVDTLHLGYFTMWVRK